MANLGYLTLGAFQFYVFVVYLYCVYYMNTRSVEPENIEPERKKVGLIKFLTYIDLLLQFIFFGLVNLNNFLQIRMIQKFIDTIFFSLALPVALLVSTSFWAIFAIDRELIFPKALEEVYPPWLNHCTHTLVGLAVVLELYFVQHKLPTIRTGVGILTTFLLTYLLWTLYLYLVHGFWVYPIMDVLSWPLRFVFICLVLLAGLAYYQFGVWISLMNRQYRTSQLQEQRRRTR